MHVRTDCVAIPGSTVRLLTLSGHLSGQWVGDVTVACGEIIDIEVDTRRIYSISEFKIVKDGSNGFTVLPNSEEVRIRGIVLAVDAYGMLTLNVAGHLIFIETVGNVPRGFVGSRVQIIANDLKFYPINI